MQVGFLEIDHFGQFWVCQPGYLNFTLFEWFLVGWVSKGTVFSLGVVDLVISAWCSNPLNLVLIPTQSTLPEVQ